MRRFPRRLNNSQRWSTNTVTDIPTIYQMMDRGTAPKFNAAFAKGCGGVVVHDPHGPELRDGPVALWGEHKWFHKLNAAISLGRTWYYGDHAYFGRGIFFRVTKNALQWRGDFYTHGEKFKAAIERFELTNRVLVKNGHPPITIESRKVDPKGFIMVCPPSEALSERSGFTQAEWTHNTIKAIKAVSDRRIEIRKKPKINRTPAPFLEAMQGAWCAVTYTGNVATEAMMGGYPCFTTGPHPANVFGNTDLKKIEMPYLPDRDTLRAWAANLCMNQWTLHQIAVGACWNAVK